MKNPFDDIQEPDIMPNPGFMCKQYLETHNYIKQYWPKTLCIRQCDECVNEVIKYHSDKNEVKKLKEEKKL